MKTNTLLILSVFVIIIIVSTKAQRFTYLNKPVVDLNRKPHVTTPKLPEERRKLSIFPKNMAKYVVTSKPYSKVKAYSPYQVTPKRLFMKQVEPVEVKTTTTMRAPVIKPTTLATTTKFVSRQITPRFHYTTKSPAGPTLTEFDRSEEDVYAKASSNRYNVAYNSDNNLSSFEKKDYEDEREGVDKELKKHSSINDTKSNDNNNNLEVDKMRKTLTQANSEEYKKAKQESFVNSIPAFKNEEKNGDIEKRVELVFSEPQNEEIQNAKTNVPNYIVTEEPEYEETESRELENSRKKRLSWLGQGLYNNIKNGSNKHQNALKDKEDRDITNENNDRNEFIFIRDYLKAPVDVNKSPNYIVAEINDSVEIATEMAWLEEYESRPKRSINIIEEENLGTTVSGFKFTGREPRVDSDLVFKNINA